MWIDPEKRRYDWDGLFTFLLTLLVIGGTLGLSLLVFYLHAWWIARTTVCEKHTDVCLLVFGKRLKQGAVDADYRLRLDKTIEFLKLNLHRSVILLGGPQRQGYLSEAKAGFDYLLKNGLNTPNIQLEQHSRNTLENLRQAREMLANENADSLVLITNRYHLARIRAIANSLGLKHRLCPAEAELSLTPAVIGKLAFEAFYILWFNTGKTWARLTCNRRMLQRVT